jgi:hypothetical protein
MTLNTRRWFLTSARVDQTRISIGFRAKLNTGRAEAQIVPNTQLIQETSPSRELPLPAILPYDSPIFVCVQSGDVEQIRKLLCNASAHINTVDPYGLPLLYVSMTIRLRAADANFTSTRLTTARVLAG